MTSIPRMPPPTPGLKEPRRRQMTSAVLTPPPPRGIKEPPNNFVIDCTINVPIVSATMTAELTFTLRPNGAIRMHLAIPPGYQLDVDSAAMESPTEEERTEAVKTLLATAADFTEVSSYIARQLT